MEARMCFEFSKHILASMIYFLIIIPYVQIYNPCSSSMLSMYHWGQAVLERVRNGGMNHFL